MELLLEKYDQLRPYQKEGVHFFLEREIALLADEMGLGKTVQTAVAMNLLFHKKKIQNALIICPTSLKTNWQREIRHWCPTLSTSIINGDSENRISLYTLPFNIFIASYDQIRIDILSICTKKKFDLVILDEAQRIKNRNSHTASSCKLLNRNMSWALTGTPIENNIDELISISSFLKHGLINNFDTIQEIQTNIRPFFLRRTKFEVLNELPPIMEQEIYLELLENQRISYNKVLHDSQCMLNSNSLISQLFLVITKLKQICNFDFNSGDSIKFLQLLEIIENAKANNKKVLLFSQYVRTLEIIKTRLKNEINQDFNIFHGSLDSIQKDKIIEKFENSIGGFDLLLISLKAGGVGLNLNSATLVILFDMWWNPAIEKQAIHRAHRFGKKEPLHVIKFIVSDTIEEKILKLVNEKSELFYSIINPTLNAETQLLKKDDLIKILKI